MSEKTLKTRIIHKHDTEAHWLLATNFIPKQGELIVYDADDTYAYVRFKFGDGVTPVSDLPFVGDIGELVIDASQLLSETEIKLTQEQIDVCKKYTIIHTTVAVAAIDTILTKTYANEQAIELISKTEINGDKVASTYELLVDLTTNIATISTPSTVWVVANTYVGSDSVELENILVNGKIYTVPKELPTVTTSDNGKVLTVNTEGKYELQAVSTGGTTVVANPTLAGTETKLNGLEVNGTKYSVGDIGEITLTTEQLQSYLQTYQVTLTIDQVNVFEKYGIVNVYATNEGQTAQVLCGLRKKALDSLNSEEIIFEESTYNADGSSFNIFTIDRNTNLLTQTNISFNGVEANIANNTLRVFGYGELKMLPPVTSADSGKVLSVNSDGQYELQTPATGLPIVTTSDAGEVLTVNANGEWEAMALPVFEGDAENGTESVGGSLPEVTANDTGKILMVDGDNSWIATDNIPIINTRILNVGQGIEVNDEDTSVVASHIALDGKESLDIFGGENDESHFYMNNEKVDITQTSTDGYSHMALLNDCIEINYNKDISNSQIYLDESEINLSTSKQINMSIGASGDTYISLHESGLQCTIDQGTMTLAAQNGITLDRLLNITAPTTSSGVVYGAGTAGQVLTTNGETVYWGDVPSQLPSVASADNGKFLTVVNGVWAATAVPNAEESNF